MYRKIVTEFWSDPKVEQMGWPGKYVLLYLFTSPLGNIAGCFVVTPKRIAKDTELDFEVADGGMREVIESGLADYCEETCEILLKSWPKHNWNASPNIMKGLAKAIESVRCESFREHLLSEYEAICERSESDLKAASKPLESDPTVSVTASGRSTGGRGAGGGGRRFSKPTEAEVAAYAAEKGCLTFDAGRFIDHYESNGWKIGGKASMKDWKAAVRNWIRNDAEAAPRSLKEVADERFAEYED